MSCLRPVPLLAFFCLFLSSATTLAQKTIRVPADQPTIQAGIDAAANGDTILVAPGTYYENILTTGKAFTLKSEQGAAKTIIDGGRKKQTIWVDPYPQIAVTIDGFTIQNGAENGSSPAPAGIYAGGGVFTIQNNLFQNNYGDPLRIDGIADVLNNHIITTSPTAGQAYCYIYARPGITLWTGYVSSAVTSLTSTIAGNLIEGDGTFCSGSGISVSASHLVVIRNNTVRGNSSGIGASDEEHSGNLVHVIVAQNLIYNNRYGGLYFNYFPYIWDPFSDGRAPVTMIAANNTLYNNVVSGTTPTGSTVGEIYLDFFFARMAVYNNIVLANSSQISPIVCDNKGSIPSNRTPPFFDHNDIYNLKTSSKPLFSSDCIDPSVTGYIGLNGNISADPQFVSPTDLHLLSSSPVIDHGNNSAYGLTAKDFDGGDRVQNSIVDMGAYEAPGATTAPTTLSLTSSSYYLPAPGPAVLTFTLTGPSGPIAGPVDLLKDDVYLASVTTDASGIAQFPLSVIKPGTYRFTAVYNGSGSSLPAISTVIYINFQSVPTSIQLTQSSDRSLVGTPVTFTATVSSSSGTPTGSVHFTASQGCGTCSTLIPVDLGTIPLDPSGKASVTTSSLLLGYAAVSGQYIPTGSTGSSADVVTHTVYGYTTSTTISSSANPSTFQQPVTFTATLSSPAAVPLGTLTISDGSTILATETISSSAWTPLTVTVNTLSGGSHPITAAFQPLRTGTAEASSDSLTQVVQLVGSAITLIASPGSTTSFQPIALTAHVAPSSGSSSTVAPAGTVQLFLGSTLWSTATLDPSGNATFSANLPAGTYTATVNYPGSSNFMPSASSPVTLTVVPAATTNALSASATTIVQRQSVTLTATISPTVAVPSLPGVNTRPTGVVTFLDGTTVLGTAPLGANGAAAISVALSPAGSHSISATYSGDANFQPSASVATNVLVTPSDFTVTASPTPFTVRTEYHGDLTVHLDSVGGLTDTIDLACANLPEHATCTWQRDRLTLPASGGVTTTATIDTSDILRFKSGLETSQKIIVAFTLLPLGLFFSRRRRWSIAPLLILLVCITGCSGKYPGHTPPGTYTIQVTAHAQGANFDHVANVTLVVTP